MLKATVGLEGSVGAEVGMGWKVGVYSVAVSESQTGEVGLVHQTPPMTPQPCPCFCVGGKVCRTENVLGRAFNSLPMSRVSWLPASALSSPPPANLHQLRLDQLLANPKTWL